MKITVWGINYSPELVGIGVYNSELCEYLSAAGHDVTMVSGFAYYPTWKKLPEDQGRFMRRDSYKGVTIWRCWQFVPTSPTVLARMVHEASFVVSSFLRIVTLPTPQVLVIVGPPLLLGVAASIFKAIKSVPFVYHIQDLQPQAAVSLGMLKPGLFVQLLFALQNMAYEQATRISSISQRMCDIMASTGAPAQKLLLLPNWTDLPDQESLPPAGSFKQKHGIEQDVRIVSYAGNLGVKQGLDLVIYAAEQLQAEKIIFIIAGNGGNEAAHKAICQERSISNVRFYDVLSKEDHTALILDSEVCLIPQKAGCSEAFLPSKLLKILSLGRPVLTNPEENSALADAIDEGRFGLKVTPGSVPAIVKGIIELLGDPQQQLAYGQAGKLYVSRFERSRVLGDFESSLIEIASDSQQKA